MAANERIDVSQWAATKAPLPARNRAHAWRAATGLSLLLCASCASPAKLQRDPLTEKPWAGVKEQCPSIEEKAITHGEATFGSRGAKCPPEVPRPYGSTSASGYCAYRRGCGKLWVCSWTKAQHDAPVEERRRHDWASESCKEVAAIPGYTPPAPPDWAAEAGSNRWLHSFGPEIALSALTTAETKGKRCKEFFGEDYFSMLEKVVAANNIDDLGDFLFLLDICGGWLRLSPGSKYDVRGVDTTATERSSTSDVPTTEQDIERMLLINTIFQAATLTAGTIGGGYYPLSAEHVGRAQLRLLDLRRGTTKNPGVKPRTSPTGK